MNSLGDTDSSFLGMNQSFARFELGPPNIRFRKVWGRIKGRWCSSSTMKGLIGILSGRFRWRFSRCS